MQANGRKMCLSNQLHMTCYLCGEPLQSSVNRDHVPPQQLWSPEIRKQFNVDQLVTLPTHPACNSAFSKDEEYVVRVLSTVASESPTAVSLVQHGFRKARSGSGIGLHRAILRSMEERPSGLHLPRGLVAMRTDGTRIKRVVWKIVRGLWYQTFKSHLPDSTTHSIEVQEPEN